METQWISVRVHPHAKKELLIRTGPARLEAWVKAKPIDGRANAAVIELLVRGLQVPRQRIRLMKGAMGSHKVFQILG